MPDAYLAYQRSKFATRLPTDRLFTASHYWLAPEAGGRQRVGFTKFATRMLGEVVEYEFQAAPGQELRQGDVIGWFEGFKAVTELYAPLSGRLVEVNAELSDVIGEIHRFPYDRGWLYRVEASPPDDGMSANEYAEFLDGTIDRMMGEHS